MLREISLAIIGLPLVTLAMTHLGLDFAVLSVIQESSAMVLAVGISLFVFTLRKSAYILLFVLIATYFGIKYIGPMLLP